MKPKEFLLKHRRFIAELLHGLIAASAVAASFLLRFEFTLDARYQAMLAAALPIVVALKLIVFRTFGLRDLAWRYVGLPDLIRLAGANVAASIACAVVIAATAGRAYPRSIYVLDLVLCGTLMVAARLAIRWYLEGQAGQADRPGAKRVLVYGAGKAGITILAEIRANERLPYRMIGFVDDDPQKRNLRIHGAPVLGSGADLTRLRARYGAEEILIAMPSADGHEVAGVIAHCREAGLRAKRIPAVSELIEGRVLVDQVRDIKLEDLLGRRPVELDEDGIKERIENQVVLVTGAGGSIGSELCRQLARYSPRSIVGFDHAETALFHIEQEMRASFPDVEFCAEVGSVQKTLRLEEVFDRRRPSIVYHAAAYKHVPMMEAHLFDAIENNVLGAWNTACASALHDVRTFVLVSSDKAVRPANVMGATKRIAELACLSFTNPRTRFMAVRFGNVLGSNGSVIPLFQAQIAAGGPVTVTHPEMRRYFMTIPEAARLVIQSAVLGHGGEIFVLDMGEPVRIVDLARNLVALAGKRPDEVRIEYSGVRPGEKLFEELSLIEEITGPTQHPRIRILQSELRRQSDMERRIDDLAKLCESRDRAGVILAIKDLVPDYSPSSFVLREAFSHAGPARRTSTAAVAG